MSNRHDSDGEEGDIYGRRARPKDIPVQGWSTTGRIFVPGGGLAVIGEKAFGLQVGFPTAGVYTVQFSKRTVSGANAGLGGGLMRAQAEILWTVEGNTTTRVVDITEGTAVSGTCKHLSVSVYDYLSVTGTEDQEFEVGITVTPGTRPTSAAPPILTAVPEIFPFSPVTGAAAGAPATQLAIPQEQGINAVFLSLILSAASTPILNGSRDVQVQQVGNGSNILAVANYDVFNRWWPIVPSATELYFFNFQAAGTFGISPIFGVQG